MLLSYIKKKKKTFKTKHDSVIHISAFISWLNN